ncbi:MAG: TolC family protein [Candidatus Hydrogenedentes bacterium]|nr:TolC family protein [Candidatus Hydrogenedentota bacterium]
MWRIIPLLLSPIVAFAGPGRPFVEPEGPLTLQRAVDAALENNPRLAPFAWDIRISDARITQARLRPNPELSVEIENIVLGGGADRTTATRAIGVAPPGLSLEPEIDGTQTPPIALRPQISRGDGSAELGRDEQSGVSGLGNAEFTLSLSHIIELGGKRAARIEAAERGRAVAEWDYEVARYEVVGDVIAHYAETLAAQSRVNEERAVVELADTFSSTVAQLVAAGSVSPLEARRARAAAEQESLELTARERELEQARLRLAATWGSTNPIFTETVGDVSSSPALPPLETIIGQREQHPALQRWGAELARRGAVFRQERSSRVPDLTVRLGYRATGVEEGGVRGWSFGSDGLAASRADSGGDDWEHSLVLEASLPLPVFHRNQGAIREAELNHEKLGDERRAWEAELAAALTELYSVANAARERIEGLDQRILPELEKTYALTREGYQRGKFAFLDVLDAQRSAVGARLELLEARISYQQAVADMERLVGAGIVSAIEIPAAASATHDESTEQSQ